ncbi:MAG: TniQ family protein [Nitrososphaera sp.]
MTLPILYSEEFVAGYVGNLRQFLSLRSNAATIIELHHRSGPDGSKKRSVINLLAAASGKSAEDVVAQHTLAPLSRAFAIDDVDCKHGADRNQTRLRVHGARFSSAYPQYCPLCAVEDKDFWGLSYWRRYHLICGIDHCLKHQETALISVSTQRPFTYSPDYHYSKLQSVGQDNGSPGKFFVDPFVRRYAEICAGLLETKLPIGRLSMAAAVRNRMTCLVSNKLCLRIF